MLAAVPSVAADGEFTIETGTLNVKVGESYIIQNEDKTYALASSESDKPFEFLTLKDAFDAINDNTWEGAIIVECPENKGVDFGVNHAPKIMKSLTIEGNNSYAVMTTNTGKVLGANIAVNDVQNSVFTSAVALTIKNLDGVRVWGYTGDADFTVKMENCDSIDISKGQIPAKERDRQFGVYITANDGTTGNFNYELTNCNFGANSGSCPVYSNANGTITIDNCTFDGRAQAICINNEYATPELTVEIKNSTFTNCGVPLENRENTYAAPIKVSNRSTTGLVSLTVDGCTFDNPDSVNGDIVVGEGRGVNSKNVAYVSGPASVEIKNLKSEAGIRFQTPGYYKSESDYATPVVEKQLAIDAQKDAAISSDGSEITVSTGTASVSGTIPVNMTVEVAKDAALEVAKDAALTVSEGATLTVNGKLTGAVAGTGKLVAGPSSDISGAEIAAGIETEIDPSAMSDMVVGGDSRTGSTTLDINQIVTVSKEMGYWNLVAGANITINGKLIVPEGTTLTVQADATLTFGFQAVVEIDGTIVIEDGVTNADKTTVPAGTVTQKGGKVVVTGTARIAGEYTADAGEFVAEQGSAVSVEETGKLASSKIVVKDSASFSVEGTITAPGKTSTVYNYGTVVFDSEVAAVADVTVVMMADGATVVVDSYTVASQSTTLTVTDKDMVLYTEKKSGLEYKVGAAVDQGSGIKQFKADENTVVIQSSETSLSGKYATVSGITIVEKLTSKASDGTSSTAYAYVKAAGKEYDNKMQISGGISTSAVNTTEGGPAVNAMFSVTVTAKHGAVIAAGETGAALTVGINAKLVNAADSKLTVEGAVVATAKRATSSNDNDASFDNNGTITVSKDGSIKALAELGATVNATLYVTGTSDKVYNYVEIDAALAMVNASGNTVKALTVLGKQTVDATSAVPADVTVTLKDAQLVIGAKAGADVTLTVSKDGALKGTGKITVNGTLFAENKSKLSVTEIVSDVMSEEIQDGKLVRNGWVKYTNIVAALNGAQAGETITISKANTDEKQYVTIASDIAVKAGVTLVVGDGVAPLLLKNGVTFTVAGTLQTEQAVFAEKQFDLKASGIKGSESSAIVVDGTVRYADGTFVYGYNATPAADGSYASTVGKAPIAGAYYTDKDYSVISTLAVAIENIEGVTSDIVVNGKVSVSDIVFAATDDCSQIVIGNSIMGADSKVKYETLFQASSLTLSDGAQLAVKAADEGSAAGSFTGTVAVGDAAVEIVGATAELSPSSDATVAAFAKESEGKLVLLNKIHVCDKGDRLAVSKGTVYMDAGFAVDTVEGEVSGVFSVASGAVLEPLTDATNVDIETLFVEGTLSVPGKTSVKVGILTVYGNVAVAAATSSATAGTLTVTTMYIGIDASDITKADTGADASVSGAFGFGAVYVADGAVLDADAVAALSADGVKKLAFIVQGKTWFTVYSAKTGDSVEKVVADNAPLTDAVLAGWSKTEGGKALDDDGKVLFEFSVNGDYEVLYAVVDTYIYKVTVVAEAGIENIAIDGKLLTDGSTSVAAGSHTVTYTLRNGYTGTAVMTVNGQKQTGLSFSTSGTSEADKTVSIQLSGITASGYVDPTPVAPEEKEDGMSLTDILLIVLVVLIVIMAAIVALRMMRS